MTLDKKLAAVCGIVCAGCEYLGESCSGCGNVEGKPFWTQQFQVEVCPLYDCCIRIKGLEHCGMCEELPCKTFRELRDPSLSPQEAEASMFARIEELRGRRDMGEDAWLEEKG
jgi:Protein of unknown function (DUF3795)